LEIGRASIVKAKKGTKNKTVSEPVSDDDDSDCIVVSHRRSKRIRSCRRAFEAMYVLDS